LTWFRGEAPGDPRPEIVVIISVAALVLLLVLWDCSALLLGARTVVADDVVDGWEPSFFGTIALVAIEGFLGVLLAALRLGAAESTRRIAGWGLVIVGTGVAVGLVDHAVVSHKVWGYLKLS
jgi:hypothetical protein